MTSQTQSRIEQRLKALSDSQLSLLIAVTRWEMDENSDGDSESQAIEMYCDALYEAKQRTGFDELGDLYEQRIAESQAALATIKIA